MSKRKANATVTLSGGGKSVTLDANTFARAAEAAAADRVALDHPAQQSFGFDTTHGFLGEEFLTWLWWRCETQGGEFELPGLFVGVQIDDVLQFAPGHDDETIQTLRRGMPTRSAEARAALRQGHRVSHARLLIADSSRQWVVTLHGADMRFGSARLPDDPDDIETQEERTADRAANWLALHEIVAGLFGQFLRVRVGEGWAQEAAAIAGWMGS